MTKPQKQSFLYGSTVLMASMLIVKLVGALFKIPLTNLIGLTGMGYFNSAYNVYTTVYALTVTGLSAAVARMVAENAAQESWRTVRRIFRLSGMLFLALGGAGFLLIAGSAKGFARLIDSPNSFWAVLTIAPAIFFCCLMAAYRGYYEGLQNMTPTAVTQVVEVLAKLAAGLAFAGIVMNAAQQQYADTGTVFGMAVESEEAALTAALPFGAAGAMLGVSVSTLIGFLYLYIRYKWKGDAITPEMLSASPAPKGRRELLRELFRIAVPITLGAVVLQLSALIDTVTIQNRLVYCTQTAPQLMQERYAGFLLPNERIHEVLYGCFTTCAVLFNLVPAFTGIFGKSALPNVTAAWTARDRRSIKHSIESILRVTMLVAAPMSFGMAALSGPILELLYGAREPRAAALGGTLLSVLMIGALFLAMVAPLNAILQGIGRMDLPVRFLLAGAVVKLALNVILVGIPEVNILGGAISTVVCYALIALLSVGKLRNIATVSLDFTGIFLKPVIAGMICGISAYLCNLALTKWWDKSIMTLVSIAVGGLCYVFFLGVLKAVSPEDIKMLPGGEKMRKILEKIHFIR